MPNNTDKEKSLRTKRIQEALKEAASVPLEIAKSAFQMIELAAEAVKKGNQNAVTDSAIAAMMARTAVLAALFNVKINLGGIRDSGFVEKMIKEVQRLETGVIKKEKKILGFMDNLLKSALNKKDCGH